MTSDAVDAVVIVGAGQAGGRAALTLREAGFAGALTLIGEEIHPPYERPPLSKAHLMDQALAPLLFDANKARDLGIGLVLGRRVDAIHADQRCVETNDGARHAYDRLILATGSRVRRLALPGFPTDRLHHLRTLDDARRLEAQLRPGLAVVIVGGGFIGLETAASAGLRGCHVTVLETADHLLPRLGSPEISAFVLRHHRSRGLNIRLGVRIERAEPSRLILSDGSEVRADLIVAGVGVTPNTELAVDAGLTVDDGVLTDAFGRTSDPAIFAAGDVTRHYNPTLGRRLRLESWQNANLQAKTAALTLLGRPVPHDEQPWVWSDQGDLNLQVVGAPEGVDGTILRATGDDGDGCVVFQYRDGRLVGGLTANSGKDMPFIRRMLAHPDRAPQPAVLADPTIPLRKAMAGRIDA